MKNQGGAGEKAGGGGAKDEGGEKQEKAAQQPSLGHYQVRGTPASSRIHRSLTGG
jgi:hypothetical protein